MSAGPEESPATARQSGAAKPEEDDPDKHSLNPVPKGGKKVHSKPLKIGFLDVEEGTLLRKRFKNKFCLLTDNRELEWFRRQEDQVERKVQGSVKALHECTVDEVDEDYLGSSCCFNIKTHGKTYTFGAANHQERTNWMVEILKLRSIKDIIDMLNHPRLSRHAAYALCNQAGNKKGDIQTDIVTLGGVDGLIAIVNEYVSDDSLNAESDDLVKSIYYAVQKLAENDKNKKRVGKHMAHFFAVLGNENKPDYWRGFAAQCITKCIENDVNKKLLRGVDGIRKLALVLTGKSAKEPLLKDVCVSLEMLCEDDESRVTVGQQLDLFVSAMITVPDSVKVKIVQIVIAAMESPEVLESVVKHPQLMANTISLLVSSNKEVQESVSQLLLLLSKHEVKKKEILENNGLINLITCACSPSVVAAETALRALESFLMSTDNVVALGNLETEELTKLISTLDKEEPQILAPASSIFLIVSRNDLANLAVAARTVPVTKILLEGLFHARTSPDQSTLEMSLAALANFSAISLVQLQLCRSTILSKILEELSAGNFPASTHLSIVTIISNCSTYPCVVKDLGHGVVPLCNLLDSDNEDICEHAAMSIGDFCRVDANCELVAENKGFVALTRCLLKTKTIHLQIQLLRALGNAAHDPKFEVHAVDAVPAMVELCSEEDENLAQWAVIALRNACTTKETLSKVDVEKLSSVLLSSKNDDVRAKISLVLRNVFAASADQTISPEKCKKSPEAFKALTLTANAASGPLLENSLWALTFVSGEGIQVIVDAGILPVCTNKLSTMESFPTGEYASQILANCCNSDVDLSSLFEDEAWKNFSYSFTCLSPKILEKLSCAIAFCARRAKTPEQREKLIGALKKVSPLLKFPNINIHKAMSDAMILSAQSGEGVINIPNVGGLSALLSLLNVDGAEFKQAGDWQIICDKNHKSFKLQVGSSSGPGSINVSLRNEDQAELQLANVLFSAFYGNPFVLRSPLPGPIPSSPSLVESVDDLPDPIEAISPSVAADLKKRGSSNFVSIGGARKRPADGQKAGNSPKAGNWNRSNAIVPSRHHVMAWSEYVSVFDEKVRSNKASVDGYIRANYLKDRATLIFPWPDNVERPVSMSKGPGQDLLMTERNICIETTYQACGPAGFARTNLVIADKPLPGDLKSGVPISYFEVLVLSKKGQEGCVGIGLCANTYPQDLQPGWEEGSFGYHSDDGNKYQDGKNEIFGPSFGTHDVIGCGIDLITNTIFYTKNGFYLGTAFQLGDSSVDLFPCVALSGPDQKIFVNFGDCPFLFDFNFANVLEFTPAPKAAPGGKPDSPNADDQFRSQLYSRSFEKLSRSWAFTNSALQAALEANAAAISAKSSEGSSSAGASQGGKGSRRSVRGPGPVVQPPPPSGGAHKVPLRSKSSGNPDTLKGMDAPSSSGSITASEGSDDFSAAKAMWGARAANGGVPPRPTRFGVSRNL